MNWNLFYIKKLFSIFPETERHYTTYSVNKQDVK